MKPYCSNCKTVEPEVFEIDGSDVSAYWIILDEDGDHMHLCIDDNDILSYQYKYHVLQNFEYDENLEKLLCVDCLIAITDDEADDEEIFSDYKDF